MEKLGPDDASAKKSTYAQDDMGELRKYIVEMMQAEMELMETIKSKEHQVAGTNARIKNVKELIIQEHRRYTTLVKDLDDDAKELRRLEEKRFVAEEKHRRFRDAVAQRESEVQVLRDEFQRQREAMLSLRCQILNAMTQLETLSSMDESVKNDALSVTAAMKEWSEPIPQRAARQEICSKIEHTKQSTVQLERETSQLIEKWTRIEAELSNCELEVHKLRELLFSKEKEAAVALERLRQETLRLIRENDKIEGKLKTKRKKFRTKIKNEISTLKRRISFITAELEKCQMTNEDMLSHIGAMGAKREELEARLSARDEQLAVEENVIAELSTAIATGDQSKDDFDTKCLQEKLATKRSAVEAVQKKLQEKQNLLKISNEGQAQVNETLGDIDTQILRTKDTAAALDGEIISLAKDLEVQEVKRQSLSTLLDKAEKENDDLQVEIQECQRLNKSLVKKQAKLRRQKASLLKQKQEQTSELRQAENLRGVLAKGIQYGTQYAHDLDNANTHNNDLRKRIEVELRHQELILQEQCAREEHKLQAEVMAWDDKIKRMEQELRIEA
uniref:Uncharacterized protein n=1 Tax=Peronospora matthiolae TaxID=2874970 RepID=A0AAV1TNH7_9STRA